MQTHRFVDGEMRHRLFFSRSHHWSHRCPAFKNSDELITCQVLRSVRQVLHVRLLGGILTQHDMRRFLLDSITYIYLPSESSLIQDPEIICTLLNVRCHVSDSWIRQPICVCVVDVFAHSDSVRRRSSRRLPPSRELPCRSPEAYPSS